MRRKLRRDVKKRQKKFKKEGKKNIVIRNAEETKTQVPYSVCAIFSPVHYFPNEFFQITTSNTVDNTSIYTLSFTMLITCPIYLSPNHHLKNLYRCPLKPFLFGMFSYLFTFWNELFSSFSSLSIIS